MQINIGYMTFFFPRFWKSELSLPFCLGKYRSALVNSIFQYLHLIHFWGQFFVLSRFIKWYKLVSVQNGSSATSSFPWYLGLFESSTTQSPVSPAICSLSRVTLSNADRTIRSWNNSASSWFLLVFLLVVLLNQRLMAICRCLF